MFKYVNVVSRLAAQDAPPTKAMRSYVAILAQVSGSSLSRTALVDPVPGETWTDEMVCGAYTVHIYDCLRSYFNLASTREGCIDCHTAYYDKFLQPLNTPTGCGATDHVAEERGAAQNGRRDTKKDFHNFGMCAKGTLFYIPNFV